MNGERTRERKNYQFSSTGLTTMEDIGCTGKMLRRTYAQEMSYLERVSATQWRVNVGFVPNMVVPGVFYVNPRLETLLFEELQQFVDRPDIGGFLPAVKQIANVACLPGIVSKSIALPDVHSFPLGTVSWEYGVLVVRGTREGLT